MPMYQILKNPHSTVMDCIWSFRWVMNLHHLNSMQWTKTVTSIITDKFKL